MREVKDGNLGDGDFDPAVEDSRGKAGLPQVRASFPERSIEVLGIA